MKSKLWIILLLSALLPACNGIQTPKEEKAPLIAMENFFKNPEQNNFNISPNGEFYAYMGPWQSRMNIFIQRIGEEETLRITSESERDIAGYMWANNNRILYLKDTGGDENYKLFGVDLDGKNLMGLTDFEGVLTYILDDLPDLDDYILIGMNKRNPQVFDPYRLNIRTGDLEMLAENPGNIQAWVSDHEGKLRVAVAVVDGINQSLLYRETEEQAFETILTTSFRESFTPYFFTFDNKNLYGTSNIGRDKQAIVKLDLATGKELEILYENPEYDVGGLNYSQKRKVLRTANYTSWKREKHFFDPATRELHTRINQELGDYEAVITSQNKNEDKFIIRTYSDRSLGSYYFYDQARDEISKITDVSPWLNEAELCEMKPIQYTSRDGLTIHGYLTLPKGYEAKNLPVIINPHGGPWYRDSWTFNPEIQFLANRGFAVLQMNFRGSTGYGRAFWEASFKEWGKSMQDDITDGVNWLIDEGIADKERIAIYGGSYGGYATLAGLTFTPELYNCGVDYVGVSNIFTWLSAIPPYWEPYLDMIQEMVGHMKDDSLLLVEASPIFHVDQIRAPLFIAQGANDPRVPKAESDQMVEALKAKGMEVEYMVKDNEGHGFRNEENRFDFYRSMESFLTRHLMEDAAPDSDE